MDAFKMACHGITWGWEQYRPCLDTARALGFRGFETKAAVADWEKAMRDDLVRAIKDSGLALACTYGSARMVEKETHAEDFEKNLRWGDFAAAHGAQAYIVGGGRRRPEGPTDEDMKRAADLLNRIGERLTAMGLRACVHPHLNTFCERQEEVDRIMALTDPRHVWLAPDTAHLFCGGADVPAVFRAHVDRIAYVHAKDTVHIHPKIGGEVGSMSIMDVFAELGQGRVPFPEIFRLLRERNYAGWITVELDVSRRTPEESTRLSRDYLRDQLQVRFDGAS